MRDGGPSALHSHVTPHDIVVAVFSGEEPGFASVASASFMVPMQAAGGGGGSGRSDSEVSVVVGGETMVRVTGSGIGPRSEERGPEPEQVIPVRGAPAMHVRYDVGSDGRFEDTRREADRTVTLEGKVKLQC